MPGLETGDLSVRAIMRRWAHGTVSLLEHPVTCTNLIALFYLRRESGQLTNWISRRDRSPWD